MQDEEVFLVTEIWLNPENLGNAESLDRFRAHRRTVIDILQTHEVEYVYYGHPFEWVSNAGEEEDVPTGIEVLKFKSEATARAALAALSDAKLTAEGQALWRKARSYLSRYRHAASDPSSNARGA